MTWRGWRAWTAAVAFPIKILRDETRRSLSNYLAALLKTGALRDFEEKGRWSNGEKNVS